ncbi:MAG: hypothetical protein JWQ39_2585 [Glaciihabitans sp.]|nr:hypothetical protein [Glaciihabitans sp.]
MPHAEWHDGIVTHAESFGIASEAYIGLVKRIDPEQWNDPGLGVWTVRDLVGHTSRAISTVETYLAAEPAPVMNVPDAETYYSEVMERYTDNDAIAARGVRAGELLGEDPVAMLTALVVRASAAAAAELPDRMVAIGPLGIPLAEYLRTRVFELVVHGIDIAKATGIEHRIPESVIGETTELAARVAARKGRGVEVLMALTGRGGLASGFSIL